jgi:hypothetical protein
MKQQLQNTGKHQRHAKLQKLRQNRAAAHIDLIGFILTL